MKVISASIVISAAALLILGGALVCHGDPQTFVMGGGLRGWYVAMQAQ